MLLFPAQASAIWEEIERLVGDDRGDVARLELEQQHALRQLVLELGVVDLARLHRAGRHRAVGLDGQGQHHLAVQAGIVAQGTVVERVDGALVLVEDDFDFLAAAGATAAAPTSTAATAACAQAGAA